LLSSADPFRRSADFSEALRSLVTRVGQLKLFSLQVNQPACDLAFARDLLFVSGEESESFSRLARKNRHQIMRNGIPMYRFVDIYHPEDVEPQPGY